MYLASNTVRGWSEETEAWDAADWAAQVTWQLAQRCRTGLQDITSVSLSHFPFFFFPSLPFPPFLFIVTISLNFSFSLALTFTFSLTHSHFVYPKAPFSLPLLVFSHTLTSCISLYNFLLSARFTFFLSHFPFLPHRVFFCPPIYTISVSHTHILFFLSFTLTFSPFNFPFSSFSTHLFPSHSLLFSISVLLSPPLPLLISFLTCSLSLSHTLFSFLSPLHTLSFCHTRLLSPTVLLLLFYTLKVLSSISSLFSLSNPKNFKQSDIARSECYRVSGSQDLVETSDRKAAAIFLGAGTGLFPLKHQQ